MQKFSSNVVEKFLQKGGDSIIAKYIEEVSFNNRIVDLMKNNYGNYVVQKALKLSSSNNKYKLIDIILKNLEKIGDKKLILKWKFIVQSHINANDEAAKSIFNNYNMEYKQNSEEDVATFNNNNTNNFQGFPNTLPSKFRPNSPGYEMKQQVDNKSKCYNNNANFY